jgi:hypothetical protein
MRYSLEDQGIGVQFPAPTYTASGSAVEPTRPVQYVLVALTIGVT